MMKIDANSISLAAPTTAVRTRVDFEQSAQREPVPQVPANAEFGTSSPDAVKTKKLGIEDRAKVEALESQLVNGDKALIIEKNPTGSGFIYKSVDRSTGEVVRVWPREVVATALQALHDVDARGLMLDESA